MQTIPPPIDRAILENELTEDIFVRDTNYGNNKIYIFSHHNSPNLMKEVGRLREVTFRDAGGGTGKALDIDEYDTTEVPFKQLIVWNPEDKEIIGGYRFIKCKDLPVDIEGNIKTPTSRLFKLSASFNNEFLPHSIELGRSFVQPMYQPMNNIRKGMYALDNIWDGLGALIADHKEIKYLFGKITMYRHFDPFARDLILHFMNIYFPDPDELVRPRNPLPFTIDIKELSETFAGNNYDADYKILVHKVRAKGQLIPPLFNAYMNLSSTMRTFGTAFNDHFGEVEETGIIITIDDINDLKRDRHVHSYKK